MTHTDQECEKATIISSDGHATARMADYGPYIEPAYREQFNEFCSAWEKLGSRNFDPTALLGRIDPEEVEQWKRDVLDSGRADGNFDPHKRIDELEGEGVVGEVLFPDFGLPFELYPPMLSSVLGHPPRSAEEIRVANKAYNRWLADFCQAVPGRFAGQAVVEFNDVEAAITEIQWARNAGLKGVIAPRFDESLAVFDARFDPIWATCVELDLPVNCHVGSSAVTTRPMAQPQFPHPAVSLPIISEQLMYSCRQLLGQLIWGGVLERHPKLKVVFTELGSGWVLGSLRGWDYSWEGSFLRRDVREVVKRTPSEYFARQCYLGSSLLSRGEVEARREIGIDKMMFGVDYPHHESTFRGPGTLEYLRATFGAARVPVDEARVMLGKTAAHVFGFDAESLAMMAQRVGPTFADLLTEPTEDLFPRGDVHKPMAAAFSMP